MSATATVIELDVREALERGEKPLTKILDAAELLRKGQQLKLISPFEPLPLMAMLRSMGLQYRARKISNNHWETLFAKELPPVEPATSSPTPTNKKSTAHTVDARGLEPPQPLVKILSEVEQLASGDCMEARTDRRPLHLLDALRDRGFESSSEEQSDGSWLTLIRRP